MKSFTEASRGPHARGVLQTLSACLLSLVVVLSACRPDSPTPAIGGVGAEGSAANEEASSSAEGTHVDGSGGDAIPAEASAAAEPGPAAPPVEAPLTADEQLRLVTLSGAVTETVAALGVADRIVGVDSSSVFPPEMSQRAQVGYHRRLSAEGLLSLQPTAVLGTPDDAPESAIAAVRAQGVRHIALPAHEDEQGTLALIRELGRLLGREAQAESLATEVEAALERVAALVAPVTERPRVLFVYARGPGVLMVGGRSTPAARLISLAGGVPAIDAFEEFEPLTPEAVVAAAPDVILVAERGMESVGGLDSVLALPGVSLTPAGAQRRVVAMDDLLLLGFGPRVAQAAEQLARQLHPTLAEASP